MGKLLRSRPKAGLLMVSAAILLQFGVANIAIANHYGSVPEGFKRLANGDIVVDDIMLAMPPKGFYINKRGKLKKVIKHRSHSTRQDYSIVKVAAPRASDAVSTNETPLLLSQNDTEFEELPPGFHRMMDGSVMANNPAKAVAPEGYHILPNGVLEKDAEGNAPNAARKVRGGGMLMFDYRYTRMNMSGMLDQKKEVSATDAVDSNQIYGYMMAPTDMSMDMHMVMAMYHTRDYMVMGMLHYMSNQMGMYSIDGTESSMRTQGLADSILTASFPGPMNLSFMIGMSFPTGSINERGPMTHIANVVEEGVKYPYGMQLGSGSYDFKQGISYESPIRFFQWSASYDYTARLHNNINGYRLGNVLQAKSWAKLNFTNTVSGRLSLNLRNVEKISGVDAENDDNKAMSPTMDARNYGGKRLDMGIGLRYETAKMTSIDLDATMPVYQDLFGPQMKTQWIATLGLGYMF